MRQKRKMKPNAKMTINATEGSPHIFALRGLCPASKCIAHILAIPEALRPKQIGAMTSTGVRGGVVGITPVAVERERRELKRDAEVVSCPTVQRWQDRTLSMSWCDIFALSPYLCGNSVDGRCCIKKVVHWTPPPTSKMNTYCY